MGLTNAEKQAAWRARREARIEGLEAEVQWLRSRIEMILRSHPELEKLFSQSKTRPSRSSKRRK
jgi:hypothetical protein